MIAKQMDVRANIKKYFDLAYEGESIIIPRKQNKNVVIISETTYNKLTSQDRIESYVNSLDNLTQSKNKPSITRVHTDLETFNLNKIKKIKDLKPGWNGNGAPAFSKELIKKVTDLIKGMVIQPEIFPTALETVQFEFDNSRRDHMEIDIGIDDNAELFIEYYDGEEFYDTISSSIKNINSKVRDFYG